jgi:prepilin-type N-terminal cleavage/methylation domain-containing protein
VAQLVLTPGGAASGPAERGFTLVEVIVAMSITIVALLANLYLFSTAQKNLAESRALTNATNLASGKIAELRGKTIADIKAEAPKSASATRDGVDFALSWVVSDVDLDHNGAPEMVGDVVKVKVDAAWALAGRGHQVTMSTFTTGKQE